MALLKQYAELGVRVRSWFRNLKRSWLGVAERELNARIGHAEDLASAFVPNDPSPENNARGEQAIKTFQEVLIVDPENLTAIDGIGSLFLKIGSAPRIDTKALEESKKYHNRHIQIRPNDPEPYYWIGMIDWTIAFRGWNEPAVIRAEYAVKYGALIDEGIASLQKAIFLSPGYYGAMTYLRLLYRRKSDISETAPEREALTQLADGLLEQVKEIRQRQETPNTPASKIGLGRKATKEQHWLH